MFVIPDSESDMMSTDAISIMKAMAADAKSRHVLATVSCSHLCFVEWLKHFYLVKLCSCFLFHHCLRNLAKVETLYDHNFLQTYTSLHNGLITVFSISFCISSQLYV